jgi:hypothetical protein
MVCGWYGPFFKTLLENDFLSPRLYNHYHSHQESVGFRDMQHVIFVIALFNELFLSIDLDSSNVTIS